MPDRGLRFTAVITDEKGKVLEERKFASVKEVAAWLCFSEQYVRVMFAAGLGSFQRTRTVGSGTQTCTVTRHPRSQF